MNQSTRSTKRLQTRVKQLTNQMKGMSLNARRRNRRRRGTGNRRALLPGGVRLVDTEVVAYGTISDKVLQVPFSPGKTKLTRLDLEGAKFGRWGFNRIILTFVPTASLTETGSIAYGVLPGPSTNIGKGDITKLKPFQKHAVWKSSSITVSNNIMIQPHMLTNGDTADHVAFTIYMQFEGLPTTSTSGSGVFKVTYDLYFNFPHP